MFKTKFFFTKILLVLITLFFFQKNAQSQENDLSEILNQLLTLQSDIKTLEKAVYSSNSTKQSLNTLSDNDEDALTRHLLKLTEIEDQFQKLTNQFEEINFRIDKLSNRVTKIQKDNQIRFQDLEDKGFVQQDNKTSSKKKELPGSSEPQDLGSVSNEDIASLQEQQETKSIEGTSTE